MTRPPHDGPPSGQRPITIEDITKPGVNFSGSVATPVIRTDIENGLIEQEGRFSTGTEIYNVEWTFSTWELSIFEDWFANDIAGGAFVFNLWLPDAWSYSMQPVRFVGGQYSIAHKGALWWVVSARVEKMLVNAAPAARTPPIPQWVRLNLPITSQDLTLGHRNAVLTVNPAKGSQTALRIYPPTDATQYIYFGLSNQGKGETLITSQDVEPLPPEPVPVWPDGMPGINQDFKSDSKRRYVRVDMESGQARQFQADETTIKGYDVEFTFSPQQLKAFQDFFFITLKAGSVPFMLPLPVDGNFFPVLVRFVGGTYEETYIFNDTFKVSAKLDRIPDQTVTPPQYQPWPVFYSPTEYIDENANIYNKNGEFFIVNPAAGETISLYIHKFKLEFGIMVIGLGNVRIARAVFGKDAGLSNFVKPSFNLAETADVILDSDLSKSSFGKPSLVTTEVMNDVGGLNDDAPAPFLKPGLELVETLAYAYGYVDANFSTFPRPAFNLAEDAVYIDIIADSGISSFPTPQLKLV